MLTFVQARTKTPKFIMNIPANLGLQDILSVGNLLSVLALVFALGRLVEKLNNQGARIDKMEITVKECEDNRIDNAITETKIESFTKALDIINQILLKR